MLIPISTAPARILEQLLRPTLNDSREKPLEQYLGR